MTTISKYEKMAFNDLFKDLDNLYSKGFTQTEIANELKICDRTIRKWECFECMPAYSKVLELKDLCKREGVLRH